MAAPDNGRPKFFDDNLILSADVADEPTECLADEDNIANVKDNLSQTHITLKPVFEDAAAVEPFGDMDDDADFYTLAGVSSLATTNDDPLVGAESIAVTTSASTSHVVTSNTLSGAELIDMSANKIGWIGLRLQDTPTGTVTVKMTLFDGTNTLEKTATADIDGAAFDTPEVWQYINFNFQGDEDIDYEAVSIVTITVLNSVSEILDFDLDGLRFTPHEVAFEYAWNDAQDVHFVQIKDCNSASYLAQYDDSGYKEIMSGAFTSAINEVRTYCADCYNTTKVKFTFNLCDYDGNIGITLGDLNVLTQIYEWTGTPKHYPRTMSDVNQESSWYGPKHVTKNRTWFECDITFGESTAGFTASEQADLNFVESLRARVTPFYYWLNGNRADNTFQVLSNVWKGSSIYRCYESSSQFKESHSNGQADDANPIEGNTIKLVEAALTI